jgi:hypothetical protein
MSSFFQKIKSLFISEEKIFNKMLLEELEVKDFLNIRKLDSELTLDKRYFCVKKLQNSRKISGVFLSEKSFFFSIKDEDLSKIRDNLKKRGQLKLQPLKDRWSITEKNLIPFLMHLEKGLIGNDSFYSSTFLRSEIRSLLSNVDTYSLKEIHTKYGVEPNEILKLVEKMIDEKELTGVLQDQELYIGFRQFEETISEFLEDNIDDSLEMTFDFISNKLKVSAADVERFLVSFVEKNPHKLIVYPLEKKIQYKG